MTEIEFKAFLKDEYANLKDKTNNYVFSCDEKLIHEDDIIYSKNKELEENEFLLLHTDLLPELVVGNLENGKIFLCTCNPGFRLIKRPRFEPISTRRCFFLLDPSGIQIYKWRKVVEKQIQSRQWT